jgi:hypothetical protein
MQNKKVKGKLDKGTPEVSKIVWQVSNDKKLRLLEYEHTSSCLALQLMSEYLKYCCEI